MKFNQINNYVFLVILFSFFCPYSVFSQKQLSTENKTLTEKQFYGIIGKYHPVVKQANLLTERGKRAIQQARGAFDPVFYTYMDEKEFDKKNYYSYWDGGLKISTLPGLDFKVGYETANGLYINPDATTPLNGLNYAGVSIPLLQNLLIDSRRAALQQAKIFKNAAEAERVAMINDVIFDAALSYWNWVEKYSNLKVFQKSVEVAQIRFEAVKNSFFNGEAPAIDTVEALIQLQTLMLSEQKTTMDYRSARFEVSNFLWYDNDEPMVLDTLTYPFITDSLFIIDNQKNILTIQTNLKSILDNHPSILEYKYKVKMAQVDKNFYMNKMLPKLNVNYNLLSQGTTFATDNLNYTYMNNNYKFGIDFSFPLFLRTERANLAIANIKIKEANYNLKLKRLQQENKIRTYLNELELLEQQLALYNKTIANYGRMLSAEEERFAAGESSLFLINSRQMKLVEAENKMVELKAKYYKTMAALSWSCAQLMNN